jgi:cerevisin
MISQLFLFIAWISGAPASTVIPGQYIVVFKDHVKDTKAALDNYMAHLKSTSGFAELPETNVLHEFELPRFKAATLKMADSFTGSSLEFTPNEDVAFIEPDRTVHALVEQLGAPWGLRRISYRNIPSGNAPYVYPASAGAGIDSYIIDTGIATAHPNFNGRATFGADFTGEGPGDGNGHGTHCAGTVGSELYGVAKKTNLTAVRVLDSRGSGSNSGVIAGIEWAAKQASEKNKRAGKIVSVANVSLGGSKSAAVDAAVKAATNAGLVMVVAAGNSRGNACNLSPAGAPTAITVAASDNRDRLASFSEKGPCVDIIAPGVDVLSTWLNGRTNTISGTSMAAPHVAGFVALALNEKSFKNVDEVAAYLRSTATPSKITGRLDGAPNVLLFSNFR